MSSIILKTITVNYIHNNKKQLQLITTIILKTITVNYTHYIKNNYC